MKIPNKLRIAGQEFEVIQTDNTTPQCQKEEILLHEAGEVLLVGILKIGEKEFSHNNWSRFCYCFYDLLERNGLLDDEKHSQKR